MCRSSARSRGLRDSSGDPGACVRSRPPSQLLLGIHTVPYPLCSGIDPCQESASFSRYFLGIVVLVPILSFTFFWKEFVSVGDRGTFPCWKVALPASVVALLGGFLLLQPRFFQLSARCRPGQAKHVAGDDRNGAQVPMCVLGWPLLPSLFVKFCRYERW